MDSDKVGIHVSDMRLFKRCRQQWHFSSPLRLNLESRTPNKNLWMGTIAHDALATLYHPANYTDVSPFDFEARWILLGAYEHIQLDALRRLYNTERFSDDLIVKISNEFELGREMMLHYLQWYTQFEANQAYGIAEIYDTEVRIEVPLPVFPGRHTYFHGTVDALARLNDGTIVIVEHKTAATIPEAQVLIHDEQAISYLWGARRDPKFDGKRPTEIMYNFLRKKIPSPPKELKSGKLSQSVRVDSSFEAFLAELRARGEDPKEYRKVLNALWQKNEANGNTFFQRIRIMKTPQALEAYSRRLIDMMGEMLDPALPIYPSPDWYKCRYCPFNSPCRMLCEGIDPSVILRANYEPRKPRWPDESPKETYD